MILLCRADNDTMKKIMKAQTYTSYNFGPFNCICCNAFSFITVIPKLQKKIQKQA